MSKRDILETIINFYTDGNKARFAKMIGVSAQTVSGWISRNNFDIDLIYAKCEGVSGDYLLTGEGEILKRDREYQSTEEIAALKKEVSTLRAMRESDDHVKEVAMELYQVIEKVFESCKYRANNP